jgi:hypothetical protein
MEAVSPDVTDREKVIALARRAGELIDEHQAAIAELSRERREAVGDLITAGLTQAQVAEAIGMTRARVGQLLSSGPSPERAFLGTGNLTVAVGGKYEAGKDQPGHVVSAEAFATYERIAGLARTLGLKAEYEVVPPPGDVQLNRTNLIVITNPRLLPFVGQVLAADVNLGFRVDEKGWYLINHQTKTEYRSPADSGAPADYAYLGRLPRPDGRGTFLYLAGIHAMGTLGAGKYLEDHIEELYREVKTRRFSVLLEAKYNPNTRELTSVDAISPIYRHEGIA